MISAAVQVGAGLVVAVWAGTRANAHTVSTPWVDRLAVALIGAAGLFSVVGVPLSSLPVIVDVRAEVVQHKPGTARLHLHGTKPVTRSMCDFLWLDAYITTAGGELMEVPMAIEGDPRDGNTRPAGRHDFGIWRVDYPPAQVARAVTFSAHHRCAWWMPITRTRQGPFALPAAAIE